MNEQNEILAHLSEDELFEIAEHGTQARIELRLLDKMNDDPQFLYDALDAIEDMDIEKLKASILENAEKYQLEQR